MLRRFLFLILPAALAGAVPQAAAQGKFIELTPAEPALTLG